MARLPSEEQGNSTHAELAADIENVRLRVGSAPSQSGEISENVVDGPYYGSLLQATFRSDWESTTTFFERDAVSKTAKITSKSETMLHIAALSVEDQFLENLIELLSPYPEALEEVDCDGRTALHNAVLCGRIRMVKALVRSNPKLTQLADKEGRVPLGISAEEASMHKEIAWFLAKSTTDDEPSHPFSSPSAIDFILDLTYAGHHDITLYLVRRYPHLMTMKSAKHGDRSILATLARRESHFHSGAKLSVLEAVIYELLQCLAKSLWNAAKIVVPIIKRVHEMKLRHVAAMELAKLVCIEISCLKAEEIRHILRKEELLFQASASGISELVKLCIQFFSKLTRINDMRSTAVLFRRERIVNLFLKVTSTNELTLAPGPTKEESEEMMFYATAYDPKFNASTNVGGAAFQMQRELQWFKAVEKWSIPCVRTAKRDGKSYREIFVGNHKTLLENGEKWAKDTANSCMLVSTLIATVLFTAAFTVPGGNDNNTGVPLLLGHDSLLVFAISDALGLFSSVTAILLFLDILNSRYEPQDFIDSLPKKIIMGLSFLFLSLAFMLVAFTTTLTIVLVKRLEWVLIPITLLASVPMVLFIVLHIPLLFQMVKSTYGPSIFRPESSWE